MLRTNNTTAEFSKEQIFNVTNESDAIDSLKKIINENKTPVILRKSNNIVSKENVLKMLFPAYSELDLRYYFVQLREKSFNSSKTIQELAKIVTEAVSKGSNLIINFDDSEKYEQLFDPDINEFYLPSVLNEKIFHPKDFSQPDTWKSHFKNNPLMTFNKAFKLALFSKFVVNETLSPLAQVEELKTRFNKSLPLKSLGFIIIGK